MRTFQVEFFLNGIWNVYPEIFTNAYSAVKIYRSFIWDANTPVHHVRVRRISDDYDSIWIFVKEKSFDWKKEGF